MNLYELQDFINKKYPDKTKTFEFDKNCHRELSFIFTEGEAHPIHHLACTRCKVTVEGMQPEYWPIQPHRMNVSWNTAKGHINEVSKFYAHDQDLHILSDLKSLPEGHQDKWQYETKIKEMLAMNEMSRDVLEAKMNDYEVNRKSKS